MKRKGYLILFASFLSFFFCHKLEANLTSGASMVIGLASSGGGVPAASGSYTLSAVSLGGYASGGAANALYSMSVGGVPAVSTFETADTDLNSAFAYPVPFIPSKGHTRITFKNLTRDAEVLIYTVSGELVVRLVKSDLSDALEWKVENGRGEKLASGVYVYIVKTVNSSKKGKLMVIR